MAINPMDYSAKDTVLDVVRTERAKFYNVIDVPQNWESPTRSGHWEVRDLVGHMIDVTEGYLTRWDMARRGDPATPLGLLVMASELDRVALTFRNLPRDEAISRLKASSDRLMNILDNLTADQWGGFNVTHVFMGPLPMFFYPAFQIMDYGVHSWDMRWGLGDKQGKLDRANRWCACPVHVHPDACLRSIRRLPPEWISNMALWSMANGAAHGACR